MTFGDAKTNLSGTLHGGTLSKVRNIEYAFERAQNTLLSKIDPIETERAVPLAQVIHDDLNNYPVPSDFKKVIDLYPQDNPTNLDAASRRVSESFRLGRGIRNKIISIEGSEGSKFMRVDWRSSAGRVLNTMDSLTTNGAWSVVGSASGLKIQEIYKLTGSASIEFDVVATGDGIQNTTMDVLDLTDEDELADIIIPIYFGSITNLTSVTPIWGNDLTTNYWTGVAQTAQADGTAFKTGWNYIKASWSGATETGTVDPADIDSFKLTIQSTGAIANVRVDNIIFSLGRAFDLAYYSKYIFKTTAGVWITRPTSDDDIIVLDGTAMQAYLMECLKICAQQTEGTDSDFDINFANRELNGDLSSSDLNQRVGLYARYRAEYPSMSKQPVQSYSSGPRFRT